MLFHPSKIPFIFWPSKKRGPNSPHCIYFPHRLLEPPTLGSAIAEEIRFFEATDILLDTSTNDGLNLIPFTFYAAHSQAGLFLDCFFHTKMWLLLWVFFVSGWLLGRVQTHRLGMEFVCVFGMDRWSTTFPKEKPWKRQLCVKCLHVFLHQLAKHNSFSRDLPNPHVVILVHSRVEEKDTLQRLKREELWKPNFVLPEKKGFWTRFNWISEPVIIDGFISFVKKPDKKSYRKQGRLGSPPTPTEPQTGLPQTGL